MPISALPSDVLSLVLTQLSLASLVRSKRTCRAFLDAAPEAEKAVRRRGCVYEHAHGVDCVAAAPGGRLITGSYRDVKVWRDGACERTIQAHSDWVKAVVVLPGGAHFVSGSNDGTAKLWTLDGALVRTFDGDAMWGSSVLRGCVVALPDGVRFVVGIFDDEESDGCAVRLYHVDGTLLGTIDAEVYAMAVTPDGQHIISGERHNDVSVWNIAANSTVSTCTGHANPVLAVAAMADSQRILSGGVDATVRVWRLNGTPEIDPENSFTLHTGPVFALAALPDNQHALSASTDNTVKLFNVNNGAVVRTFTHHTAAVTCLALMPDGLRFVSGSVDNTARVVEIGPLP